MKKLIIALVLAALFSIPGFCQETEVAEHWSPYSYPTSFPEGARVHIIADGDTLWDLAMQYYDNPLAWPNIHSANPYISDPHWIYPGDPLVLPDLTIVEPGRVTEQTADSGSDSSGDTDQQQEEDGVANELAAQQSLFDQEVVFETEPRPSRRYELAARELDLYCSSVVYRDEMSKEFFIAGTEEDPQIEIQMLDIVYINRGSDLISPGDEFLASNYERKVYHPHTNEFLGHAYQEVGVVRVLLACDEFSVAEVIENCDGLNIGSILTPLEKRPNPVARIRDDLHERNEICVVEPELRGHIIYQNYDQLESGQGDVVNINLGAADGLKIGDSLIALYYNRLYQVYPDTSDKNLMDWSDESFEGEAPAKRSTRMPKVIGRIVAEGVVIHLTETTATVKFTYSVRAMQVGTEVVKPLNIEFTE